MSMAHVYTAAGKVLQGIFVTSVEDNMVIIFNIVCCICRMFIITILLRNRNIKQTCIQIDISTPTQVNEHALYAPKRAKMAHVVLYLVFVHVSGLQFGVC